MQRIYRFIVKPSVEIKDSFKIGKDLHARQALAVLGLFTHLFGTLQHLSWAVHQTRTVHAKAGSRIPCIAYFLNFIESRDAISLAMPAVAHCASQWEGGCLQWSSTLLDQLRTAYVGEERPAHRGILHSNCRERIFQVHPITLSPGTSL